MKARHQFLHLKRLGQIVVGPCIDSFDTLHPAATRGQNDHWHVLAVKAPALEYCQAIHAWKPKIENDGRKFLGITEEPRLLAVVRKFHPKSASLKPCFDVVGDRGLVLNH